VTPKPDKALEILPKLGIREDAEGDGQAEGR
jgi:hypothetical protein